MKTIRTFFKLFAKNKRDIDTKFETLLKDLIILSYDREKQLELIGHGNVGTEMILNFSLSSQFLNDFVNSKMISLNQKNELDNLIEYFDKMESVNENLKSDEWKHIRETVKNVLETLNSKNLKVVLDRGGKFFEAKLISS